MSKFGDYLGVLRIKKGFRSQRQLALACGISATTVCRIEKGVQKPDIFTLVALAQTLEVEYGDLVCQLEDCPIYSTSLYQEEQLQEFSRYMNCLSEKQRGHFFIQ